MLNRFGSANISAFAILPKFKTFFYRYILKTLCNNQLPLSMISLILFYDLHHSQSYQPYLHLCKFKNHLIKS